MKDSFFKTLHHFFPSLSDWLRKINDPRNPNKITYPIQHLLWTVILLFVCKLGARRQIKFQFNTPAFLEHLNLIADCKMKRVADPGTLHYLLNGIPPQALSRIRHKMLHRLIRMRCLEKWRLLDRYYLIAFDGTGMLVFYRRHCEHCLTATIKGRTYYYHHILEAKLVLENGLVFSIDSEFIENIDPKATKQDCEIKAFYRLASRVKAIFPQLRICLLLDSLYASKPVLDICKSYDWKYIITLKEGALPDVFSEFEALKPELPENVSVIKTEQHVQKYHWVTDIPYHDHMVNVLECIQMKDKPRRGRKPTTRFVWLTNLAVNKNNCDKIANQGGRLRWKIENEGFNMQKNGGYNLKHPYALHGWALKNFYILLQIAHILNQLMEKGSLLRDKIKKLFGSIRNIASRLLESLRTQFTTAEHLQALLAKPFQIRFDSS